MLQFNAGIFGSESPVRSLGVLVACRLVTIDFTSPHFSFSLAAALVLAFTPGQGITYVVARTASGGRQSGVASSFGTGAGGLVLNLEISASPKPSSGKRGLSTGETLPRKRENRANWLIVQRDGVERYA